MTEAGDRRLREDEGCVLTVYDDGTGQPIEKGKVVQGNPTIGIGRNLRVKGISVAEKEYLYANDKIEVTEELSKRFDFWKDLDPIRQDVLVNMAFNLGVQGLLGFCKMLDHIRAGDYIFASIEIMNSKAAVQLPERYERLARAMHKATWEV